MELKCPNCGILMEEGLSALSRADNKTEICPICGQMEALVDFKLLFRVREEREIEVNEMLKLFNEMLKFISRRLKKSWR